MPATVDFVASDLQLPKRADVVIVGGGIIGVSTALFLAEHGLNPVLCEKGVVAGEQSSRNWGWCRTMGRDPRELPLAIESLRLWREINKRIGAETGYRQIGTFYICPNEADLAKREAWLPYARAHGLDSRLLRRCEASEVLGGSPEHWAGGLYTPTDGVAEPHLAAPAIAMAARRRGAAIFTNCAVRGLELSAGRVSRVVTEKGSINCDTVVLAGGAWSSLFCRNLGIRLPQLKVLASVFRTSPCSDGPPMAAWGPGLSLRKRLDGGYTVSQGSVVAGIVPDSFRYFRDFLPTLRMEWKGLSLRLDGSFLKELKQGSSWKLDDISPFERSRILDPAPSEKNIRLARDNLVKTFPAFISTWVVQSWAGLIDISPDTLPVISPTEALPGLYLSTGYSGHGFGIGLGAGRLTAELVIGKSPVVDPHPYRLSRFTDGSLVRPLAGL